MFNLTQNSRRATRDIDFDFICYSIEEDSINAFINKLNQKNDGLLVTKAGPIKQLHQEDYRGVRIHVAIKDANNDALQLKMDIGVHTHLEISQRNAAFSFFNKEKTVFLQVNPPEQIFAEKIMSLGRLGAISTRYKDLYDMYYLSSKIGLNKEELSSILKSFFNKTIKGPRDFDSLRKSIQSTLNNEMFKKEAINITNKWLDADYEEVKTEILKTLSELK